MPKFIVVFAFLLLSTTIFSNSNDTLFTPRIEGTIRAKYEYNVSLSEQRFQVRNARFSINGKFSNLVSYKAEIDLSDEGETKMLDAFLRYHPESWFTFTVGQQKIPFSTDNIRSPHQLFFSNRSFIGKQLTALRDVGATVVVSNPKGIPIDLIAGIYNGTGLYNQKMWRYSNELSYSFRTVIEPFKNAELTLNYNSVQPYNLRMNMFNVGGAVNFNGLHLESEFYYKTYNASVFNPTSGFFAMAAYGVNTPKLIHVKNIKALLRFDNMTNNNKGKMDAGGNYMLDDIARSRVTAGLTFSFSKPFLNDIRLNYEQYFFPEGYINDQNKLVVEYVVRF
ncbi:MAG: porin [Paludibacter sp.]|nr:porin [Paludibacter sp.]